MTLLSALLLLNACTIPAPQDDSAVREVSDPETVYYEEFPSIQHDPTRRERHDTSSGARIMGNPEAPIEFLLFTHHSCDYCKMFDRSLMERLRTEFIETDAMQLSISLVPLEKYPESDTQPRFLSCALRQGKGWEMHRALFDGQPTEEQMTVMEIDTIAFTACMEDAAMPGLRAPSAVTLVPSYAINGTLYTGLPEWSELRGQINEASLR